MGERGNAWKREDFRLIFLPNYSRDRLAVRSPCTGFSRWPVLAVGSSGECALRLHTGHSPHTTAQPSIEQIPLKSQMEGSTYRHP